MLITMADKTKMNRKGFGRRKLSGVKKIWMLVGEKLLKNGVPIDPDLVEEVTGGDRSNITIPKAEFKSKQRI